MNNLGLWFKGLRGKLLLLVVIPVTVIGALSALSFYKISYLGERVENVSTIRLPIAQLAGDLDSSVNAIVRWLWTATFSTIGEERTKAIATTEEKLEDFKKTLAEYGKMPRNDKAKEVFKAAEENIPGFIAESQEVLNFVKKNNEKDDDNGRNHIKSKVRGHALVISKVLDELDDMRRESAKKDAETDLKDAAAAKVLISILGASCSLLLFFLGVLIASRLSRTLSHVTERISDSGTQVSSASEQLSSASQALSSGATEAASSLEETVSSLEELSSMVKLNADNAKEASSLSLSSRKSAEDGESEIKNLIGAMTDISQSSKKIEEIINVIDDIAFQTNLLALNAAVEAARAGEQGKGFAVVAEAVRNLAQRSASAAKDITVLIKESVEKISHGSKIADQSGEVLKNIVTSVKKVSDLNNEIASASAEQSNGISQISKAMNELDQATQRNAASAEETAASSEEMSAQAIELQGMVTELGAIIAGSQQAHVRQEAHSPAPRAKAPNLKMIRGSKPASMASQAIPFDDDQHHAGKVGTTDGF